MDDRLKISELSPWEEALTSASFVPFIYEGVTYRYDLRQFVGLAGNQTIAGVKTFSSSPIVPDGDATTEAVNKGQLDTKADIASPTFTGIPSAPTADLSTNTTQIATTAFVKEQEYAPIASPTFTGTPAAPTAELGTDTTQVATTAFVNDAITSQTDYLADFRAYDSTRPYALNEPTFYLGVPYKSLANDNEGNTPDSSPLFWEITGGSSGIITGTNIRIPTAQPADLADGDIWVV